MSSSYIPEDVWSAQQNSPAEQGVLTKPDPVARDIREQQWIQYRKAVLSQMMVQGTVLAANQAAHAQQQQEQADQFPQTPEQQVPWMAESLSGKIPLDRVEARAQGASGAQQQALLDHITRIKTQRTIWDWFYKRGQDQGTLEANAFGYGAAQNVLGPATFQKTGIDALYDEVKQFVDTGDVSLNPPGFEHGLIEKGKAFLQRNAPGWMGMAPGLQPNTSRMPLPGDIDRLLPKEVRGELALTAASKGYEAASGRASGPEKVAGAVERLAGFLLPGGAMMKAGKGLALKGAEALLGPTGKVGQFLVGSAGAGAGFASYEAAVGLPAADEAMLDRVGAARGPEARESAKGKLTALRFGQNVAMGLVMELAGKAVEPLTKAIQGPVTKGISVLGEEGSEVVGKVGIGGALREKTAQFVGGAAQGAGLNIGGQALIDSPAVRAAYEQIVGEKPGMRTALGLAAAGVLDPNLTTEQRVQRFKDFGKQLMTESAVFGAWNALQAVKPRYQAIDAISNVRAIEEVIGPEARAAARKDPDLAPMAGELFPSPPERAPEEVKLDVTPAMRAAEPGEPLVGPERPISELGQPETPKAPAVIEMPGPVEAEAAPEAGVPPQEPTSQMDRPSGEGEPSLPSPLTDKQRAEVSTELTPGTTFRMRDTFGGRELEVVSGTLKMDKKGRWGGAIRVKDGDREVTFIPEMLDQVERASLTRPVAQAGGSAPSGEGAQPTRQEERAAAPEAGGAIPSQPKARPPERPPVQRAAPKPRRVKARVEEVEHPFNVIHASGERFPVTVKRAQVDPTQFIATAKVHGQIIYEGGTLPDIYEKLSKRFKLEPASAVGKATIEALQEARSYEAEQKTAAEFQGRAQIKKLEKQKADAERVRHERGRKIAEEMARKVHTVAEMVKAEGGLRGYREGKWAEELSEVPLIYRRKNGQPLDKLTEMAKARGLLPADATESDFIQALTGQSAAGFMSEAEREYAERAAEQAESEAEEQMRGAGDILEHVDYITSELEGVRREMAIHGATAELKSRLSNAIASFRDIPSKLWSKARETPEGRTLSELLRVVARGVPTRGGRNYIPPDFGPSEMGGGTIPGLGPIGKKIIEVLTKSPESSTQALREEMTFRTWRGPQGVAGSILRPFTKLLRRWLADQSLRQGPEIAWIMREQIYNEAAALATAADIAYGETGFMRGIKPDSDADTAAFMAVELFGKPEGKEFRDELAKEVGEKRADEVIAGIQDFHRRARRLILRLHPKTIELQEQIKEVSESLSKLQAKFDAAPEKVNPSWRAFREQKLEAWRTRLDALKAELKEHRDTWGLDWRTYMHHAYEAARNSNPRGRDAAERAFKRKATPGSVGFRALKHRTGKEGYVPSMHVAMGQYIPGLARWIFGNIAQRKLKALHDGYKTSLRRYKDDSGQTVDPMEFVQPRDQLFYGPDAVEVVSKTETEITIRPVGTAPEEKGGHFPEITLPIEDARSQLKKLGGGLAQAAFEGARGFEEREWEHQLNLFLNRYPALKSIGDKALAALNSVGNVPFYTLAAYHPLRSLADYTIALPWMIGQVGMVDFPRYSLRALRAMGYGAARRALGQEAADAHFSTKARADWIVMRQTGMVHGVSARDFRSDSSALNMPFSELPALKKIPRAIHNILIATWNNKEALMHGSMALAVWERNPDLPRAERMGHAREAIEKASGAWASALAPGVIQNPFLRFFTKLWGWAIRQPSYFIRDIKEAKAKDRMEGKRWYGKFQPGNHNWNRVMRKVLAVALISYLAEKLFGTDTASQYGVRLKTLIPWLRDLELETGKSFNWLTIPGIPERLFDPTQSITPRIAEGLAKVVGLEQASEREVESTLRTFGKMMLTSLPYEIQEYYRAQVDKETGQFIVHHPADRQEAFFPWADLTGTKKKAVSNRLTDWLSIANPGTPLDTMLRMQAREDIREERAEKTDLSQQRTEAQAMAWKAKTPEEAKKWEDKVEALNAQLDKPIDYAAVRRTFRNLERGDDERFMFSTAAADERAEYLIDHYLRMGSATPQIVEEARSDIAKSQGLTPKMREALYGEKVERWLEKRAVKK